MSYTKLHKTITDFSAGIQTVNGMRDNLQAVYDAYAVEHSLQEATPRGPLGALSFPPPALAFGHHNTPKIPRVAMKTALYSSSFSIVIPGGIASQPMVTSVARLSTGLFFIAIAGLDLFFAEVEAYQTDSTSERIAHPTTNIAGGGTPSGIFVECYQKAVSGGGFDLVDYDFSAIIYGTTPD